MKKAVLALLLSVLFLCSVSLPAFAADFTAATTFVESYIRDYASSTWINSTDWTSWNSSTGELNILRNSSEAMQHKFGGFKASFNIAGYVKADPGYYLQFMVTVSDQYTASMMPSGHEYSYGMNLVLNDGQMIDLQPSNVVYNQTPDGLDQWTVYFTAYVGGDRAVSVTRCTFITDMYSLDGGNSAYSCWLKFNGGQTPTDDTIRHLEMVEVIESSADKIIENADENTEEIVGAIDDLKDEDYGYEGDPNKESVDQSVEGLADQINELSDDIDKSVVDFKESVKGLSVYINTSSDFVFGWLEYVPKWLIAIISAFSGILIARKIVK